MAIEAHGYIVERFSSDFKKVLGIYDLSQDFGIGPSVAEASLRTFSSRPLVEQTWNWGDGQVSEGLNGDHTYGQFSVYQASLFLKNDLGEEVLIPRTIDLQPVFSDFTVTPAVAPPTLDFDFSSISAAEGASIVTFAWDFGDPASGGANTSALPSPSHIFTVAEEYVVTLVVTDSLARTHTKTRRVRAGDFVVSIAPVVTGMQVDATQSTPSKSLSGTNDRWFWEFSVNANNAPDRTIFEEGSATFGPQVMGAGESGKHGLKITVFDDLNHRADFEVSPATGVKVGMHTASFSFLATGLSVAFTNTSPASTNGGPYTWEWNFDRDHPLLHVSGDTPDGGPGNLTAVATVTLPGGSLPLMRGQFFAIVAEGSGRGTEFTVDVTGPLAGNLVIWDGTDMSGDFNPIDGDLLSFIDEAFFETEGAGVYTFTVTHKETGSDPSLHWVRIDDAQIHVNAEHSTVENPVNVYSYGARFAAIFRVTDTIGETAEIEDSPQVFTEFGLDGQFTFQERWNLEVFFSNFIVPFGVGNTITGYLWDFDDPGPSNSSTLAEPSHVYSKVGVYFPIVTVSMSQPGGPVVFSLPVFLGVTVVDNVLDFDTLTNQTDNPTFPVPVGQPVKFNSLAEDLTVTDVIEQWDWDFGGLDTFAPPSVFENPIRCFETPGTKTITLDVTTKLGSTAQIQQTLDISLPTQWARAEANVATVGGYSPDLLRTAGPVKALRRVWLFAAPDDETATTQRLMEFNPSGNVLSSSFTLSDGVLFNPARGRMAGDPLLLAVVGGTDTLYYLEAILGPLQAIVFSPYTLHAILFSTVEVGGIYILAKKGNEAVLLFLPSIEKEFDEHLLGVRLDPRVDQMLELSDGKIVFFNGPHFLQFGLTDPVTGVTWDPATKKAGSLTVRPYGASLAQEGLGRDFLWSLSSVDEKAVGKALGDAGAYREVERHLTGLLIHWAEYDGRQNIWFYGTDLLVNDDYADRAGIVSPTQPAAVGLLGAFNVVLREVVWATWMPMTVPDRGVGSETDLDIESSELGAHELGEGDLGENSE